MRILFNLNFHQIFNDPLRCDDISSSGSPPQCFVVRAQKKFHRRAKPRCPCRRDSPVSSSSSVSVIFSDSDSITSEEFENEQVIRIEIDDESDDRALLEADGSDVLQKKQGKVQRIVGALSRVPLLGKKSSKPREVGANSRSREVLEILQSQIPENLDETFSERESQSNSEELILRTLSLSSSSVDNGSSEIQIHLNSFLEPEENCHCNFYSDFHPERAESRKENLSKYIEVNELTEKIQKEKKYSDDSSSIRKPNAKIKLMTNDKNLDKQNELKLEEEFRTELKNFDENKIKSEEINKLLYDGNIDNEGKKVIDSNETEEEEEEVMVEGTTDGEEISPASQQDELFSNETTESSDASAKSLLSSPTSLSSLQQCESFRKKLNQQIYRKQYSSRKRKYKKKSKKMSVEKSSDCEEPGQKVTGFRPIIYPISPSNYDPNSTRGNSICQMTKKSFSHEKNKVTQETSTSEIPMYNPNDMNIPSTSNSECQKKYNLPILRRFLPLFQAPELIEELEERERLRLLEQRAERRRFFNAVRIHEPYRCPGINSQVQRPFQFTSRPSNIVINHPK